MKKIITMLLSLVVMGGVTAFAKTSKEDVMQKNRQENEKKELYRAELEAAMLGFRQGAEYSLRNLNTVGVIKAKKHGFHYLAGYRFTKHWYVGGVVGIDLTTPTTITRTGYLDESLNYSIERKDKVYVPVMADVRFYFKPRRISTYLFTNLGAEFSSSTAMITTFGLGWDVHTVKDQCVNIGLGVGMGSWETAPGDLLPELDDVSKYGKYDGFVFNFKLGYSF